MRLNAKQIAEYTAANVLVESMEPSRLATGITWDSRTVKSGDVYLALPGERVDGHDFVESALCAGAIIALVMRPVAVFAFERRRWERQFWRLVPLRPPLPI